MALTASIEEIAGRPTEIVQGGSGEPLVFLHGGSMIGGIDFLDSVTDTFHVVVPFLPGYGRTEPEPVLDGRDATVRHLLDVLDALHLDRVVLVGHSLGGWRATVFTAQHPERVRRLVLAAPAGMQVPGQSIPDMRALSPSQRLDTLTYDAEIKRSWMPDGPTEEYLQVRGREQQAMARFAPGPVDPELPAIAGAIKAETLLIWGEGDLLNPVANMSAWQDAIPQATTRTYPGAGHIVFNERPEALEHLVSSERQAAS